MYVHAYEYIHTRICVHVYAWPSGTYLGVEFPIFVRFYNIIHFSVILWFLFFCMASGNVLSVHQSKLGSSLSHDRLLLLHTRQHQQNFRSWSSWVDLVNMRMCVYLYALTNIHTYIHLYTRYGCLYFLLLFIVVCSLFLLVKSTKLCHKS